VEPEPQDQLVLQAQSVQLVLKVCKVYQVHLQEREILVIREAQVPRVQLDLLVFQVHLQEREIPGQLVQRVALGQQDRQVQQDRLVKQDRLVILVQLVAQDLQVQQELLVPLVQVVQKVLPDEMVLLFSREIKETLVTQVPLVQPGQLVEQVHMVSVDLVVQHYI
jgi:hypothetical protein